MDRIIEARFRSGLEVFLRKSIDQINSFFVSRGRTAPMKSVNKFWFTQQGYWYDEISVLDAHVIASLYHYHGCFRFPEALELAQLIIDESIFQEIHFVPPIAREAHDPDDYIGRYLTRILEDYCEIVNEFKFSKRIFNFFFREMILWLEDDHFFCELAFVIPDLIFLPLEKGRLLVENDFMLERATEKLRTWMVNDLKWEIFHSGSINYDLIISSELVLRKVFRIPKDQSDIGSYTTSYGSTNWTVQKEIKRGIEAIKKLSIYQWKLVHTSNVFYKGAPTIWTLERAEWTSDPNFDFHAPNLIRYNRVSIRGGFTEFKRTFRKVSTFHFDNFQVPFGRYLSALKNEKTDQLNAVVDYVVLFESLLLDTNNEITFQFGLFWGLFFSKNKSERKGISEFFRKIYALRSDLVHWNDGKGIKKTLRKLNEYDPEWFRKLKKYSHEMILFLIKKNIWSKKALIEALNDKLYR